jgi:hypothetical protein
LPLDAPLIVLFVDSLSAIQSIVSQRGSSDHVRDICNLISNFRSAGTLVSLYWIPSHCGISGNEKVDSLAKLALTDPLAPSYPLSMSLDDALCLAIRRWRSELFDTIRNRSGGKHYTQLRSHLSPLPWHFCSSRPLSRALHRLRSGHNRLNYFQNKLDPTISPMCSLDCNANEDVLHVLVECPFLSPHRTPLLTWLRVKGLEPALSTILGFNTSLSSSDQFHLRDLLAKFVVSSDLILRL